MRRAANATAIAAGVFVAFVLALLVSSHLRGRGADLLDPPEELAAAKRALAGGSEARDEETLRLKEELRRRVRELDLSLRRDHFRRRAFEATGALLLLCGVVVLVASIYVAGALDKKVPRPEGVPDGREGILAASRGRLAVSVLGALLAAAAVAVLLASPGTTTPVPGRAPDGNAPGDGAPAVAAPGSYPSDDEIARNWPRFRGPRGSGVSAYDNVPVSWDEKSGKNILWKADLPLGGACSPVVWGKRVFVTGAGRTRRAVYCFDADTGGLLWADDMKNVPGSPAEAPKGVYDEVVYAASTPATDGERVYAVFANGDIAAVDHDGRRAWALALGLPRNEFGHSSSLALWRNLLVVQFDQSYPLEDGENPSAIFALDSSTGRVVWKTERNAPDSWATPAVMNTGGRDEIVTAANPYVVSYDPSNGTELWRVGCLGDYVTPSPIHAGGVVLVVMEGHGLIAIRPGGAGDVTKTHVAWTADGVLPDASSPVSDGELVFTLSSYGLLTCFSLKEGLRLWEMELGFNTYSSPALAGGRLYVTADDGATFVLAAAREPRELAKAKVDDYVASSLAFGDGRVYIRGNKKLYCIQETGAE